MASNSKCNQFIDQDDEFQLKKAFYNEQFTKMSCSNDQITTFNNKVLPALCSRQKTERFRCLFDECLSRQVTFQSKQSFFRHLQSRRHSNVLPNGGKFLTPNSCMYHDYKCKFCLKVYNRKDKFDEHKRFSKSCSRKFQTDNLIVEEAEEEEVEIEEIEWPAEKKGDETDTNEDEVDEEDEFLISSNYLFNEDSEKSEEETDESNEESSEKESSEESDEHDTASSNDSATESEAENKSWEQKEATESRISKMKRNLSTYSVDGSVNKKKSIDSEDELLIDLINNNKI